MGKSIFEGVKFGDKFVTRDGRIAIYVCQSMDFIGTIAPLNTVNCIIEGNFYLTVYNYDGTVGDKYPKEYETLNIISKYQEPIDEEKLDELAENYCISEFAMTHEDSTESAIAYNAYKAGYRKAMEE